MSFTGDLEHLPIIDIVQLLHQTRKTGTLCLKSYKGESQLVFKDGYIVSANHHNNNIRIGRILADMGAVTEASIEKALIEQGSGEDRKPLVAILIESGQIDKKTAFRGLETLIELTIVEVLTWNEGTFTLDITAEVVSDEYRYFPEKLHEDLVLDTQNVLMDALRIYDERNRDGQQVEDDWINDDEAFSLDEPLTEEVELEDALSAEDLGLDDLESLERKIPDVFLGLREENAGEAHRQVVLKEMTNVSAEDRERFVTYLQSLSVSHSAEGHDSQGGGPALILFSRDGLLRHSVSAAGRHEGFFVFTTDEADDLEMIIHQTLNRERLPILILDKPEPSSSAFAGDQLLALRRDKMRKHPSLPLIQLVGAEDSSFSLQALQDGVRAVFVKPAPEDRQTYATDMIRLLDAFRAYAQQCHAMQEPRLLTLLHGHLNHMRGLTKAPEIAFDLLKLTASLLDRSVTLVVNGAELVAERSIGIKTDGQHVPSAALKFTIPLNGSPSIFRDVIESGHFFYGQSSDKLLNDYLFPEIGRPDSSQVLLVPLKCFGRTIAVVYSDFGSKSPFHLETSLVDMAAQFGSLVLDNAVYRSRQGNKSC